MSFSYWGADKVTVQKSTVMKKNRLPASTRGGLRSGRRGSPLGTAAYGRESSANAKFGTRLVADDSPAKLGGTRPTSRRHGPVTSPTGSRRPSNHTEESATTTKSAVTKRPAWDGSTRTTPSAPAAATATARRPRANSHSTLTASTSTQLQTTPVSKVASIAPSEDSGVGMYRKLMVNNPSFEDHDPN